MARPSKPVGVIEYEKKSHRTKAEIEKRKEGEAKLLSGIELKERREVRDNERAHKEFIKLKKLMKSIKKNDALYENAINRYALLLAECTEFEEKREKIFEELKELDARAPELIEHDEMSYQEYFGLQVKMQNTLVNLDKQVQAKRKMLLDIEKENAMTIAAALRMVPKQEEKENDPLLKILRGG